MTATEIELEVEIECEMEPRAHRQRVGGRMDEVMEHYEAVEMMATEKYLLDEMTPEVRDAFEEHYFGCQECAQDVQLGAAFIDHAKVVLPEMMSSTAPVAAATPARREPAKLQKEKRDWFAWLRPAVMVPTFACLLAVIGYQNLVVYPALQASATGPRILPAAAVLHDGTRSAIPVVYADLKLGTTLTIDMPVGVSYNSYKLDFYDSKGNMIWTRTAQSDGKGDDTLSFWLSSKVRQDTYKLVIRGVTATGETVLVKQQMFELQARK